MVSFSWQATEQETDGTVEDRCSFTAVKMHKWQDKDSGSRMQLRLESCMPVPVRFRRRDVPFARYSYRYSSIR